MTGADWSAPRALCLGMGLPGDQIDETGEQGEPISGQTFALLFNAHYEAVSFRLGARRLDMQWTSVFDTAAPDGPARTFAHMSQFPLQPRSLAVLRGEILAQPDK